MNVMMWPASVHHGYLGSPGLNIFAVSMVSELWVLIGHLLSGVKRKGRGESLCAASPTVHFTAPFEANPATCGKSKVQFRCCECHRYRTPSNTVLTLYDGASICPAGLALNRRVLWVYAMQYNLRTASYRVLLPRPT